MYQEGTVVSIDGGSRATQGASPKHVDAEVSWKIVWRLDSVEFPFASPFEHGCHEVEVGREVHTVDSHHVDLSRETLNGHQHPIQRRGVEAVQHQHLTLGALRNLINAPATVECGGENPDRRLGKATLSPANRVSDQRRAFQFAQTVVLVTGPGARAGLHEDKRRRISFPHIHHLCERNTTAGGLPSR